MATKNNPGKWDCYANAAPDEPMFVLLGRDPTAALLVHIWCALREGLGDVAGRDQLLEAEQCAEALEAWARGLGKDAKVDKVREVFVAVAKGAIAGDDAKGARDEALLRQAEGK